MIKSPSYGQVLGNYNQRISKVSGKLSTKSPSEENLDTSMIKVQGTGGILSVKAVPNRSVVKIEQDAFNHGMQRDPFATLNIRLDLQHQQPKPREETRINIQIKDIVLTQKKQRTHISTNKRNREHEHEGEGWSDHKSDRHLNSVISQDSHPMEEDEDIFGDRSPILKAVKPL